MKGRILRWLAVRLGILDPLTELPKDMNYPRAYSEVARLYGERGDLTMQAVYGHLAQQALHEEAAAVHGDAVRGLLGA
jgi:hypothetical protein